MKKTLIIAATIAFSLIPMLAFASSGNYNAGVFSFTGLSGYCPQTDFAYWLFDGSGNNISGNSTGANVLACNSGNGSVSVGTTAGNYTIVIVPGQLSGGYVAADNTQCGNGKTYASCLSYFGSFPNDTGSLSVDFSIIPQFVAPTNVLATSSAGITFHPINTSFIGQAGSAVFMCVYDTLGNEQTGGGINPAFDGAMTWGDNWNTNFANPETIDGISGGNSFGADSYNLVVTFSPDGSANNCDWPADNIYTFAYPFTVTSTPPTSACDNLSGTMSTTTMGSKIDCVSEQSTGFLGTLVKKYWPFLAGTGILLGVWHYGAAVIGMFL